MIPSNRHPHLRLERQRRQSRRLVLDKPTKGSTRRKELEAGVGGRGTAKTSATVTKNELERLRKADVEPGTCLAACAYGLDERAGNAWTTGKHHYSKLL